MLGLFVAATLRLYRLVVLACFSWKLIGITTTATAVVILEVALGVSGSGGSVLDFVVLPLLFYFLVRHLFCPSSLPQPPHQEHLSPFAGYELLRKRSCASDPPTCGLSYTAYYMLSVDQYPIDAAVFERTAVTARFRRPPGRCRCSTLGGVVKVFMRKLPFNTCRVFVRVSLAVRCL